MFQNHLSKLKPVIEGSTPNEWAANTIISEDDHKPYFLEWTPRCFSSQTMLYCRWQGIDGHKTAEEIFKMLKEGKKVELLTREGMSPIIDYASKKYTGYMVSITVNDTFVKKFWPKTGNKRVLTVTMDHPISTDEGFINADSLHIGDNIEMNKRFHNYQKSYHVQVESVHKMPVVEEMVYDFKVQHKDHVIVTGSGIVAHNCGWDATFGELALLQDAGKSLGEFYIAWATKQPLPKDFFPYGKWSAAVRLFSKGAFVESEEVKGRPIQWKPELEKNFWWYGVREKDGMYEITGNAFGVATAIGDTPEEAISRVYDLIKPENLNIQTLDVFYSPYIGKGVSETLKKLKDWNIIN
jgi:hypothetical protein